MPHNYNLSLPFSLALPRAVRFGWGCRAELAELIQPLGSRVWVVCGSRTLTANGSFDSLLQPLRHQGIDVRKLGTISREPTVSDVDYLAQRLCDESENLNRAATRECVMAIGGGATIDLVKAVAAMATNRQSNSVVDFLEGVGKGLTLEQPALPVVAIPTTAGTGSEATKNAVISSDSNSNGAAFKKSLRDPRLIPKLVLLDPELAVSSSPEVTAHSGMDAITQLIESFVSRRATSLTSALCLEGLTLAIPALPRLMNEPQDRPAREAMSYAAFLSGVALANSGLGLAHGVSAALGIHASVPHGLACAMLLPTAMRFNRDARPFEFAKLGRLFGSTSNRDDVAAQFAVTFIEELCLEVGIPQRLSTLGITEQQLPAIVAGSRGNSMNGNPRDVSDDELLSLLHELL